MIDFNTITLHKEAELIRDRALSPVELIKAHLARIEDLNPSLNAYVAVAAESALSDAQQAEKEIMSGRYRGPHSRHSHVSEGHFQHYGNTDCLW